VSPRTAAEQSGFDSYMTMERAAEFARTLRTSALLLPKISQTEGKKLTRGMLNGMTIASPNQCEKDESQDGKR
jgi:hypothetical protein